MGGESSTLFVGQALLCAPASAGRQVRARSAAVRQVLWRRLQAGHQSFRVVGPPCTNLGIFPARAKNFGPSRW